MIFVSSNKLNLMFPIKLFNTEYLFLKNKYIIIKYIYLNFYNFSFIKSIKFINNIYYTVLKLSTCIKKSNTISRNNLHRSTKKLWNQKGLGKARIGSLKSPLLRGGSILFGPISRILFIKLQTKKNKISFFYLLLNKRTYISFLFLIPTIHTFNNIKEYLFQQKRINGFFSTKLNYIFLNDIKYKKNKYYFSYFNSLNIISLLKFDYIIFLI